jgi:ribosomal protein L9
MDAQTVLRFLFAFQFARAAQNGNMPQRTQDYDKLTAALADRLEAIGDNANTLQIAIQIARAADEVGIQL